MSANPPRSTRLRSAFARRYVDLWLTSALTVVVAGVALTPATAGHPVRIALAVVFVLFIPGYAFVSALFPDAAALDGIERVALAVGVSVALTALIALGVNFTPWGIRLVPVVAALTTVTLVCLLAAAYRRQRLHHEPNSGISAPGSDAVDRSPFEPPVHRVRPLARDIRDTLTGQTTESRLERALTIALVLSIVLAAGAAAWALSTPRPGSQYTEFYLLTVDDDGDLVAGHYPANLTTAETADVVVGITNHEFKPVTYTVVIRVRDPGTNRTTHIQTLEAIQTRHNTTWLRNVSVTPPFTGDQLRLEFLLYRENTDESPYRELHLVVNVSEPPVAAITIDPLPEHGPIH